MTFMSTRTSSDERRVIVIGSGPSGAIAALALVRRGIPVTLLESGQNVPSGLLVRAMGKNVYRRRRGPDNSRHYIASGDPDTAWRHTLTPGGLSNYWTGAVPRFAPEDFHEGERLHERYRWPVSYDELVPYYEVAERLLVVVGAAHDVPGLPASHVSYRRRLAGPWRRVAGCAEAFGQGLTPLPLADGPPWMVSRIGGVLQQLHAHRPAAAALRAFRAPPGRPRRPPRMVRRDKEGGRRRLRRPRRRR